MGFIVQILVNCLLVEVGHCTAYCAAASFTGLLYLVWYLLQGYKLYLHSTARKIHILYSTLMISCSLNYLMLICPINPVPAFSFIDLTILLIAVSCFLYVYEEKRRFSF